MNGSNMRDKARAIFGKTFFENTKEPAPAKNAAVALQKRANARPIPTYKVGGVVKKQAGGALTAAEKARAQAMIKERGDAAMRDPLVMRFLDEQNRAPMSVPGVGPKAATKRAEGGGIEAQRLEARADAGRYKDGGKIAKKASGGMSARSDRGAPVANAKSKQEIVLYPQRRKDGGKIKKKAIGGVMEQYDTMPSSVQQTGYQQAAPAYGEYGAGPKPMQKMVDNPNPMAPAYKKGGKVMKKAAGGAMPVAVKPPSARRAAADELRAMQQARLAAKKQLQQQVNPSVQAGPMKGPIKILTGPKREQMPIQAQKPAPMVEDKAAEQRRLSEIIRAEATPGMKKGGSAMTKPVKKAMGGGGNAPRATGKGLSSAPSQGYYSGLTGREQHGIKRAEKTVAPRMGSPVKRAVGGAGKTRKGK